jgi:hypothetical protein
MGTPACACFLLNKQRHRQECLCHTILDTVPNLANGGEFREWISLCAVFMLLFASSLVPQKTV